jgi:two-component system, chemotaxis family, protein-glutamate methylesterase/glutaminase
MDAFPADIRSGDGEQRTGMICPDCSGSLVVRAIGDDVRDRARLVFKCRVGHAYGLGDLLVGKEEHIERTMWAAVFAYEEIAAILRDAARRDGRDADGIDDAHAQRRIERAEQIARGLRDLIDRDESIRLKNAADE